jgi:hypothetical protein
MEHVEQLQHELSRKTEEYNSLLNTYKYFPPGDPATLFSLKRKLVQVYHEKSDIMGNIQKLELSRRL